MVIWRALAFVWIADGGFRVTPATDGKIKAPPPGWLMWLVGLRIFTILPCEPAGSFGKLLNDFNVPRASTRSPNERASDEHPR